MCATLCRYDTIDCSTNPNPAQFIAQTFLTATPSISINGLDLDTLPPTTSTATGPSTSTNETIEYEPFDPGLSSRVASLHATLESLTTAVARLRRDAPGRAAAAYGKALKRALAEDEREDEVQNRDERGENGGDRLGGDQPSVDGDGAHASDHREETGSRGRRQEQTDQETNKHPSFTARSNLLHHKRQRPNPSKRSLHNPLRISFGLDSSASSSSPSTSASAIAARWHSGEPAAVYTAALRTLARLQGGRVKDGVLGGSGATEEKKMGLSSREGIESEVGKEARAEGEMGLATRAGADAYTPGSSSVAADGGNDDGNDAGLARTMGRVERARQAVEVVERQ